MINKEKAVKEKLSINEERGKFSLHHQYIGQQSK